MRKTHKRSCHCGTVRFAADATPEEWIALRVKQTSGRDNACWTEPDATRHL